ncbi:hypothetical protein PR048_011554 [Dryococelus australis]|uniref:Uncharacterized protein n=1 Tax=Dryococelus australis TaxID=614101 RepID=A0ABQ9HM09_9NEOP|nr:hypothetical protein PR048_011554 [Dryococelus australis]
MKKGREVTSHGNSNIRKYSSMYDNNRQNIQQMAYICLHLQTAVTKNFCTRLVPQWNGQHKITKQLGHTTYFMKVGPHRQHQDDIPT